MRQCCSNSQRALSHSGVQEIRLANISTEYVDAKRRAELSGTGNPTNLGMRILVASQSCPKGLGNVTNKLLKISKTDL